MKFYKLSEKRPEEKENELYLIKYEYRHFEPVLVKVIKAKDFKNSLLKDEVEYYPDSLIYHLLDNNEWNQTLSSISLIPEENNYAEWRKVDDKELMAYL